MALFGPSKEEVWRQLAEEIQGEYRKDGFLKEGAVVASVGEWKVHLDTHTLVAGNAIVVHTRMRAPFVNPHGFRFKIFRAHVFSDLARFFGQQDIQVGHPAFDESFVIQGNQPERVVALLDDKQLRALIHTWKSMLEPPKAMYTRRGE